MPRSSGGAAPADWMSQEARPEGQSIGSLIREAVEALDSAGISCSTSRATRLVRAFLDAREDDISVGTWVLTYSDPTGERAVWNVLNH